MHRNRSAITHNFAMTPRADIPRATFRREWTHKTTFDSGYLIPIMCDEVLPGDTIKQNLTMFARMVTPIFPVMDNLYLDTFFFYVPNRVLWTNFKKMMGEQTNPGDSISYTTPQVVSPSGGFAVGSMFDYFGLPTVGQVDPARTISVSAFWSRAYNLIYNNWFRDENLQNAAFVDVASDGPDNVSNFILRRRGKRFDYFTGCLPWPQKGATPISLPLGSSAPVVRVNNAPNFKSYNAGTNTLTAAGSVSVGSGGALATGAGAISLDPNGGLIADLSAATAATINSIRLAFQTQKLLERDARGGTRYTEIVRSHFGVISPDARLQRPEYLGGSSQRINISPIAQTAPTTDTTTPMGTLAAVGQVVSSDNSFMQSFTEHGVILGLCSVRADLTYQQGIPRMFSRSTRYSYYMPVFCSIGEQTVLNKEIYATGTSNDDGVFGYQEAWAEYRYKPSQITGYFRSTTAGTLDAWHLAQRFSALPALNSSFIEDNPPVNRVVAVGAEANGAQFYADLLFTQEATRQMPMYSVPGMIDHF